MIKVLKISGQSLEPEFLEGDYVIILKAPAWFNTLKSGDIIVFKHKTYGTMIKLLDRFYPETNEVFVLGTHPESVDSRSFGAIPVKNIIGKVVYHIQRKKS
jgi:signal peptidase I